MKKYYLGGFLGMILLFFLACPISCICSCATINKYIDKAEKRAENTIILRYFDSDDYSNAKVYTVYIEKNKEFCINYNPVKEGCTFTGWYNSDNYYVGQIIADQNGKSIVTLSTDTLLYPMFRKDDE